MSGERWHGTYGGYKNHGCRCDECKAANRDAARDYYRRNPDKARERQRAYRQRNPDKVREGQRVWRERLNRGEVVLPELDWAICARGGSEAQARAHRRRGQKPCANCLAAERFARNRRAAS